MYYVPRTVLAAIQMLTIIIVNNISSSTSTTIIIMVPSRWYVRNTSRGNGVVERNREHTAIKRGVPSTSHGLEKHKCGANMSLGVDASSGHSSVIS